MKLKSLRMLEVHASDMEKRGPLRSCSHPVRFLFEAVEKERTKVSGNGVNMPSSTNGVL